MENIMGKAAAGMAAAGESMRRGVHNTRQEGKVADLRKQIDKITFEIGKLTVISMDGKRDLAKSIKERYTRIGELRDQITKAKTDERHDYVTCPHCRSLSRVRSA